MARVQVAIGHTAGECLAVWEGTPGRPPRDLRCFSARQQRDNEQKVDQLLRRASEEWEHRSQCPEHERALLEKRVRTAITTWLLRTEDPAVESFMEACSRVGHRFATMARDFDHEVADADVLQALRNQWVFNSIQEYLGLPVTVTRSSFAYSMLYPYTDNMLDRGGRDDQEKQRFLDWLSQRLRGRQPEAGSAIEHTVSRLLAMIEEEFPRTSFPDVHQSLLAIHEAQTRSLSLRGILPSGHEPKYLMVSIEKGGTSVLADGLLATGIMIDELAEAMFIYGVLLQLIDDLQDMDEDTGAGHSTAFTRACTAGSLEHQTNRLLGFMQWCLAAMHDRAHMSRKWLCELIGKSCAHLIFEAVGRQRHHYSASYLAILEPYTPLSLGYLGDLKARVTSQLQNVSIMGLSGESDAVNPIPLRRVALNVFK